MHIQNVFHVRIIIVGLAIVNARELQIGGKKPKFARFDGMCPGNKDTKLFFDYYGIKTSGNKLFLNCTITVTEDVNAPPTMRLKIQRCRSKENLDTCEDFHSFTTNKYCQIIESDSELWNPFFATIRPKWKCPIKKGVYKSINSEFDITAILLFPADGWFWKVKGDLLDGNSGKRIMCVVVEAEVLLKKKKL